jgi:hypothetical protein
LKKLSEEREESPTVIALKKPALLGQGVTLSNYQKVNPIGEPS